MFIDSTTNWNWLLEKSKKNIKNNDNKKLKVVINKAITLSLYIKLALFIKGLHNMTNIPSKGTNNNEKSIIRNKNYFLYTYLGI